MAGLRATPSVNSTLFSPYKILFGEEMRLPLDTELIPTPSLPHTVLDRLQDITNQFEITRAVAKQNIEEAQAKNKRFHDRKAAEPTFNMGDLVVINNVQKQKGLNPMLQPKKLGPFYICDVNQNTHTYLIRDCVTHKQLRSRVNAKRLTKFIDNTSRNIKPSLDEDLATLNMEDLEHQDNDNQDVDQTADKYNTHVDMDIPPVDSQVDHSNNDQDPTDSNNTQSDSHNSQMDTANPGVVQKIIKCTTYQGKFWYNTCWVGEKFAEWVVGDILSEEDIRKFHINKTLSGKARKRNKKSK